MRFECYEHGETPPQPVDGSLIGSRTKAGEPSPRDLEGILLYYSTENGVLEVNWDSEYDEYMSKFSDIESVLIDAVKRDSIDLFHCPECYAFVWLLDDDEDTPEP